jgi:hypothetical protein
MTEQRSWPQRLKQIQAYLSWTCHNRIGDEGGLQVHKVLSKYKNFANVTEFNGQRGFVGGARIHQQRSGVKFLLDHVRKPVEKRMIPSAIRAAHQDYVFREKPWLTQCDRAAAGFLFYLLRTTSFSTAKQGCLPPKYRPSTTAAVLKKRHIEARVIIGTLI